MKARSASRQACAVPWCCRLYSSYLSRAAAGSAAERAMRSARRPDVTAKSKAAESPPRHRGT
eukprot:3099315-Pyramimonas_sp.AAC.1